MILYHFVKTEKGCIGIELSKKEIKRDTPEILIFLLYRQQHWIILYLLFENILIMFVKIFKITRSIETIMIFGIEID